MKVEILANDVVIGTSELDRLDPPMGVAIGAFVPTDAYVPTLHAGTIEGERNEVGANANLIVRGPHGRMRCTGVWIDDYQKDLDEIEVSVLGISDFQTLFGNHPDYLAYWREV